MLVSRPIVSCAEDSIDTALGAALGTLIASSPNIIIAVWVIVRQDRRIDELLTAQRWLIEQLMALHPPQAEDDAEQLAKLPSTDNS